MGSLFSRPNFPPPAPATSIIDSEAAKEAARLEAERLRKRRGAKSTILTGGEGLGSPAPVVKTKLGE